jgi:hypothetical protein
MTKQEIQQQIDLARLHIAEAQQKLDTLQEQPLMIGGVEVKIKDNRVTLGQYTYPKPYLESLRTTCRDFNEPITTELLTKIIDKLK